VVPTALLAFAALLAKESAFPLFAAAAFLLAMQHGARALMIPQSARGVWAMTAASLAYLVPRMQLLSLDIRHHIQPADNPLMDADLATRLVTPLVLLGKYLAVTVAPTALTFDYNYDAIHVSADPVRWEFALGLAAATALAALALRGLHPRADRGARALAGAAFGFAASYSVFSNTAFMNSTLFAERLMLGPSFWLVLLATHAATGVRSPDLARLAPWLTATYLAMQAAVGAHRTWEVRSELTLFQAQVETAPYSVKGQLYYAKALARSGQPAEALWHFGLAVSGRNAFPALWRPEEATQRGPITDRLQRLPALLAPGAPPEPVWLKLAELASAQLGPEPAAIAEAMARR
jgi:hypothetical protein